ncbi:MAG: endonuclease V [Deltaproteobacteria bacterium]|nr:endonuclease V [Deltaproteobacteria bacterium]
MPDIVAVDTAYSADKAVTAGVLVHVWDQALPEDAFISETAAASEYISGQFYKRELPCILNFLKEVSWRPDIIIIDGYVFLAENTKGLGQHLYEEMEKTIPVIGVAKRPFAGNTTALPVYRGLSKRPLYVTAAGISLLEAAQHIKSMYGNYRIPVILKAVDNLSKNPGLLSTYTRR